MNDTGGNRIAEIQKHPKNLPMKVLRIRVLNHFRR